VGGKKDRDPIHSRQANQELPESIARDGVDARCRLIENEHLGFVNDCDREREPLANTERQTFRQRVGDRLQAEAFLQFMDAVVRSLFRQIEELRMQLVEQTLLEHALLHRALANRIWERLDPVLTRYFLGMIVVMIYATAASYVGLKYFLGIEHAILLALLTGILETVPVIGPTSAAIIAGLVSLRTATGLMSIIDYALYATALRLSIDQLIGPFVLGTAAHVHPVLIIFCFLAGGIVFGIPGVIMAVPVALLIKSTLATLYGDEAE